MNDKHTGLLLVFIAACVSGFSVFINSFAVKGFDSSVFTFSKNLVVAVLLFSIVLGFGLFKEIKELTRDQWMRLAIIGLVGGSIPFLLFFKGLAMADGSAASFIHKLLFIFVTVFSVILLREKINKLFVAGAILLITGTAVFIVPKMSFSIGLLLILLATMMWALENVLAKKMTRTISGTTVAFGRMFFGSLFIFLFLLLTGKAPLTVTMGAAQYGWIAITSIFLFGYVLAYYNGIRRISVIQASCVLTLGAPMTALLSFLWGSTVPVHQWIGMLIIAAGAGTILFLGQKTKDIQTLRDAA